jgi:hypothetical protein
MKLHLYTILLHYCVNFEQQQSEGNHVQIHENESQAVLHSKLD